MGYDIFFCSLYEETLDSGQKWRVVDGNRDSAIRGKPKSVLDCTAVFMSYLVW